ncbi:MAG: TetR/AcrR family transcriptional regulator [Oscillospiraceae bacterium]|nr:TetR/AcrR family transcriptional regulator [Oscillospiraceae bacterium]
MENEKKYDLSAQAIRTRREELAVASAARLFLEKGLDNVRMTDIADDCGVGVATLYRYFGTKTIIAIEAVSYLWNDLGRLFEERFREEELSSLSGIERLDRLIRMFTLLYSSHKDFIKLLDDFDRLMVTEGVPKEQLAEYEKNVFNFYNVLESAYLKGCEDKSVRTDIDFRLYYLTFTHALTQMCKKFIQGEILPSDDFSKAKSELDLMADAAVGMIRA